MAVIPFTQFSLSKNRWLIGDGTAAAPAIAFASEPTSGFYRIGANQLGWSVAGVVHGILTGYKTQLIPNTLTGSLAISALTIDQTWNTTGAPVLVDWIITDTASDPASFAFRIRGGASGTTVLFSVSKAGLGIFGSSVYGANLFANATGRFGFDSRSVLTSASDGAMALTNYAITGATSFSIGPTAGNTANGTWQMSKVSVTCTIATDINCSGKGTGTITVTGAANLIQAGSVVFGVTARVSTILAGSDGIASWALGYAGDTDAWGAAIALAAGTTVDGTKFTVSTPLNFSSATAITFSGTGGKIIDSGEIKITIYYFTFIPISA